ncbi:MAG: sigma 54-interacting transcriptional regulator [Methylococcales bacterium]|nr:sigma 54-interacting transcriptional regulator [Methylococcales bacterium]
MLSTEVFLNFLLSTKQITGAETVSLVINDNNAQQSDVMLVHEGSTPLSEFVTVETALEAANKQSNNESPIIFLESIDKKGMLIRINSGLFRQHLAKSKKLPDNKDRRDKKRQVKDDGMVLLGLSFGSSSLPELIETLIAHSNYQTVDFPETSVDWFVQTLCQGGVMVWQAFKFFNLFKDPTSCLPGRMAFQVYLKKMIVEAVHAELEVGLIFINPDEFVTINQRLGWSQGDLTLTEISDRLQSFLRETDLVFRYGGAIFALILPTTNIKEVNVVTEKIRKGLAGNYSNITTKLTFSIGAAIHQPNIDNDLRDCVDNLVKQADQALNVARLSGGGKSVLWEKGNEDYSVLNLDNVGDIVTSESEKDYRNMLLLWDTIAVISNAYDAQNIAIEFVDRVKQTLKPFRIGLFQQKDDFSIHPLVTLYGQKMEDQEWQLSTTQKKLLNSVQQGKRTERIRFTDRASGSKQEMGFVAYGFPLLVRDQSIGYLYIDGPENSFIMGSSDLVFLNALTCQLAIAFDRAALESRVKEEKERESQLLKKEVRELRKVIHSAKLIYRSTQMQSLLEMLSSVAPTDVTILVNGESGTGKEMLARAIHEQSPRKNKPLITVDCGAIAVSLMESELFGHVKGAYTGAQGASPGRILQAEGGTLFLDEIGELPLDVQAKLLRFVQEKEVTPVGGGETRKVDVRIVAATNRNLAEEVAAGRFRGDLYYRLQVITLLAPSLRERPDDIIPLARHFLEKFAVQYEKGILYLSEEAERALLVYQWPGNIRELQNTIMRAAVISKKDSIDVDVLNLKSSAVSQSKEAIPNDSITPFNSLHLGGVVMPVQQTGESSESIKTNKDVWGQLKHVLREKLLFVLQTDNIVAIPLGRWLTEDLVLEADRFDRGVVRRAALRLGIPETTFRRQIVKLKQAEQAGVLSRTPNWANIKPFLAELVTNAEAHASQNILEQVRLILLQEIIIQIPNDKTLGAALMGVTTPTYQRWLDKVVG